MGGTLTREKASAFSKEKKRELKSINRKFKQVDERLITIIGPPQAGKSCLMNALDDIDFCEDYKPDETAKMGYKIFSTVRSEHDHLHPIAFQMTDTPGSLIRHKRATEHYFTTCDAVLITFDMSMQLDEIKVDQWTQFAL